MAAAALSMAVVATVTGPLALVAAAVHQAAGGPARDRKAVTGRRHGDRSGRR
jgi:hypothetical protein